MELLVYPLSRWTLKMSFIVTFFRCSQGHQVEKREKNSKDIYIGGSP